MNFEQLEIVSRLNLSNLLHPEKKPFYLIGFILWFLFYLSSGRNIANFQFIIIFDDIRGRI